MKGSLIIVSFFIVGTLCGFFHLIPYDFTDSKLSYYALCGLMFCVGTSIGNDPNTLSAFIVPNIICISTDFPVSCSCLS